MGKLWRIPAHDSERIAHLERQAGIPAVLAQLLVGRGVEEPARVKEFLDSALTGLRDPGELPGVDEASQRIHQAILDRRRIVVYGDYDADGMTATAILYRCLQLLGAEVSYYVPSRLNEGYGLNSDALQKLRDRKTDVVVTVDCGIASLESADICQSLGLELIVTDHHEMKDRLPNAACIVHPRLPGHNYPFDGLCGAGVAFKLAWAICQRASQAKRVSPPMREYLLMALGLVSIGTVADVVPLLDENRILVKHGLTSLKKSPPLGVAKLMQVTKLDQKSALGSEDIGFTIAPRLNAAGRLGQAQLGVELLTTESPERAESLAEYIHELNRSRDSLERRIYLAARKQVTENFDVENDPALVLAERGWHVGVIGIVAGRLAERYHRPVVMIALDELDNHPGVGSARSAGGLQLHTALAACDDHLISHGGHAAAAGLKIDAAHVDQFRSHFLEYVASERSSDDLVPEIRIDAETPFSGLGIKIVEQIERLAPFGNGNPRPVLCTSRVQLAAPPKRMGGGDRHLSLSLTQHGITMRAVAFGMGEWAEELGEIQDCIDIAYRPVINEFRGRRSVEIHLVDWRPSEAMASVG